MTCWLAPILGFALLAGCLGDLGGNPASFPVSASYPEGPLIDGQRLLFAEMGADRITEIDLASRARRTYWQAKGCGPTSIAPFDGGYVVLCHLGHRLVLLDAQGLAQGDITHDEAGARLYHPNDAHGDGKGGVYFTLSGDFMADAPARGAVYYLSRGGQLRLVAEGLAYANGVLVADGNRLFVSEHLARRVARYVIEGDGGLRPDGFLVGADLWAGVSDPLRGPDGLSLGPRGSFYIADYGGARVLQVSPEGKVEKEIPIGAPYVTNMAYLPGARHLFVTAAIDNRRPPLPGAVYRLNVERERP